MKKVTKLTASLVALAAFAGSLSAQSFAIAVENGQLLDTLGTPLTFAQANVFYAFVEGEDGPAGDPFGNVPDTIPEFDLLVANPSVEVLPDELIPLAGVSFTKMIDGTPIGVGWMNPGAPALTAVSAGLKPIVVFTDAADVSSITIGDQVAIMEGASFLSSFDNRFMSVGTGGLPITLAGVPGSIQMVPVVPEPSTFALFAGLLGLGLVIYRRRR